MHLCIYERAYGDLNPNFSRLEVADMMRFELMLSGLEGQCIIQALLHVLNPIFPS